jgi:peptidoglycan/LPS O-acetylase OafA/YrhL
LDGLRAVAIGLVMAFHFTSVHFDGPLARIAFSITRGGWIGVDLFFVLSGFLITGICLDEQGPGFFRAFYGRRALRILPAYFLALAVITGLLLLATGRTPVGLAWMTVFATNIVLAHSNSLAAVPSIAQHLWSVSVEEQFYVVWPICVTFLPRRLAFACALLAIPVAAILRGWFVAGGAPIAAHELTVARMDALASGAVVAFVSRSSLWPGISRRAAVIAKSAPLALWVLAALAICVAASAPVMSSTTTSAHVVAVLRYSVLSVIGAAAVILGASTRGEGPLARFLTRKSVQWLGR